MLSQVTLLHTAVVAIPRRCWYQRSPSAVCGPQSPAALPPWRSPLQRSTYRTSSPVRCGETSFNSRLPGRCATAAEVLPAFACKGSTAREPDAARDDQFEVHLIGLVL